MSTLRSKFMMRSYLSYAALLAIVPVGVGRAEPVTTGGSAPKAISSGYQAPSLSGSQRSVAGFADLPMVFEPNRGQTSPEVRYLARGRGYTVYLTETGAVLDLKGASPVRMTPACGPLPGTITGAEPTGGTTNYLLGNKPSGWITDVPNYRKVFYKGVCPGVDLTYYGNPQELEYDLTLAAGADPSAARMRYDGITSLRVTSGGDLALKVGNIELVQLRPYAYQNIAGRRVAVETRYLVNGNAEVGFAVASYNKKEPIVIDPVLVYSTYMGGTGGDSGAAIAVDASGSAYVTGQTQSLNFPIASPLQPNNAGSADVFVAKISADGLTRVYATYVGGTAADYGLGIAVDGSGNAYVVGQTASPTFPAVNAVQTLSGTNDAFALKLNAAGSAFVYSTYLGGDSLDEATAVAVDSAQNAYVTGWTIKSTARAFPTTGGVVQALNRGNENAFVVKLSSAGAMSYSTCLGGTLGDLASGIAVDGSGDAYVTGSASSANFPVTGGAFQTSLGGRTNAFVTKLNSTGTALVYSTYLGGSEDDHAGALALDTTGNVYLAGTATSANNSTKPFPLHNPIQGTYGGGTSDGFAAELNAAGNALVFSTYVGGNDADAANAVAIDGSGIHLAGSTKSPNFTLLNSLYSTGGVFVAELNPAGDAYLYSTRLTGATTDAATGIAVDAAGNAYVTGTTSSANFPTAMALQGALNGTIGNAFITVIAPNTQGGCSYALTPPSASIGYSGGDSLTFGIATSAGNCAWTVLTPVNWLKALPDSGSGNGTITYSVYPNYSTLTRSASLVVGGKSFAITQGGAPGTPDERFVQSLYFNFYGRRPSPAEISFQVTNGVGPQGRAQVALNFFNGAEFLNGGRYIAGLYFGLLGRAPDYNGWLFQRNAMARNIVDPIGLITNFLNGAEFQQKYGTLTDAAFVTLLYNQILLRAPDPQGLNDQVNGIHLYGRAQIAYNMLSSAEFQVTTGPRMSAFLLYACLLQRDASVTEANALVTQIQQGATFLSLISNFVSSGEFALTLQ